LLPDSLDRARTALDLFAATDKERTATCPDCNTELSLLSSEVYPHLDLSGGNVADLPGPITDQLGGGNVVALYAVLEPDGTYVCPECKQRHTFTP